MRLRVGMALALATLLTGSVAGAQSKDSRQVPRRIADASSPSGTGSSPVSGSSSSSGSATAESPTSNANSAATSSPASVSTTNAAGNIGATGQKDPEEDDANKSTSFALQQLGVGQKRWYQVGAVFETHRLLRQDDLGGAARNKALNYLNLYAGIRPTARDQFRVVGGFTQRFLADGGETGIRADDITLTYMHTFSLPWEMSLRPSVGNLFPISFDSKLMGLYSSPRASLLLMRNFLDGNLNVIARAGGAGYITKYTSATGGSANPYASVNAGIALNYSMPFHNNLQVGGSFGTGFFFNNEVEHGNDPTLASQNPGNPGLQPTKDPQFASQPVQQTYGGEVYVGYQLPNLMDTQSNIQLALSQGESNNVIHDGNTHVYWMFRRAANVYLALQVQY